MLPAAARSTTALLFLDLTLTLVSSEEVDSESDSLSDLILSDDDTDDDNDYDCFFTSITFQIRDLTELFSDESRRKSLDP